MGCGACLRRRKSTDWSRWLQVLVDGARDPQGAAGGGASLMGALRGSQASPSSRTEHRSRALYLALRPQVAKIARALMGENPPADLVHDICVDVTLSRPRFRGDSAFSTWLYAIADHHVRNWMRKERSYRKLIRAAEQGSWGRRAVQPDEAVDVFMLADRLRTGIAALTDAERACLVLVCGECLSSQEVATLLHITPTAVRMNVHRARARLRRWLAEGARHDGEDRHQVRAHGGAWPTMAAIGTPKR